MTAAVAVGAIELYQRFVSPYKGFCCAHRAVHGRRSCSQFAKRLVAKVGLLRCVPLFMGRLRTCGEVARALKAGLVGRRKLRAIARARGERDERERREPQRSTPDANSRHWGDCGGCDLPDVGGCGTPNVSGCDVPVPAPDGCDGCSGCDLSL
jgi:putative component of membrane protein insertase Oxa1/YidC/SpoIIIJ protein YidD